MTARIAIPTDRIATFCERRQVAELALFGSAVRDDFRPDSDVDVLVSFDPGARRMLFDMVRIATSAASAVERTWSVRFPRVVGIA